RFLHGNRAALDSLRQGRAVNKFEYKEACVIDFFEIVDSRDVRVIQRCKHFRFALEAVYTIRITREFIRQNLDRHVALELCIARTVDLTHAAAAKHASNFVWTQLCADGNAHEFERDYS